MIILKILTISPINSLLTFSLQKYIQEYPSKAHQPVKCLCYDFKLNYIDIKLKTSF